MGKKDKYVAIKWVARIAGLILAFFTLFIGIGEAVGSYISNGGKPAESLTFLLIATFIMWFACMAGYIWAWWDEFKGSIASILCATVFFILLSVNPEAHLATILVIYLIPPVLFLLYWWLAKYQTES